MSIKQSLTEKLQIFLPQVVRKCMNLLMHLMPATRKNKSLQQLLKLSKQNSQTYDRVSRTSTNSPTSKTSFQCRIAVCKNLRHNQGKKKDLLIRESKKIPKPTYLLPKTENIWEVVWCSRIPYSCPLSNWILEWPQTTTEDLCTSQSSPGKRNRLAFRQLSSVRKSLSSTVRLKESILRLNLSRSTLQLPQSRDLTR